uniref:Serine/arginine-rich splicing factor 2 n=1 Tax=Caenorhabditis tropicalis TaxID=1561998 RepID=A0A1I7TLY5_9PELO
MGDEVFKAFVGGLPFDSLASDVETILEFCDFTKDQIAKFEIHLVHDRESGNFKGFAYVSFENEQQLNTAIEKLNGVDFASRTLKVNRAQPRDRNDRGGRGGGRGGFGGDRGHRGGRGGGGGGFRRGGGGRFNDNEGRGGFGGGGHRGYRQRKESGEIGGSQHEDGHNPRPRRQSEESGAPSAPPAERPRLNLKPRTTDPAEIEARKKKEEEETRKRQEKLFQ